MRKVVTKRRIQKVQTPRTDYFVENKKMPYYGDVNTLKMFLTERGKIIPRSRSGLNAKNQRLLTKAIKYARHLALIPFISRG